MRIKSAKSFRTWYKTEYKKKKIEDTSYDENFVGTYYDLDKDRINGFYELFHGDKPNIANDLMDGLKNAQDSQAIYEFIQNAADCNSDYFAVYYNDEYFLAINNGDSFKTNDLRSILNANQSTKTNHEGQAIDCSKIGRFGIGFKLVHRLVGENDGKNELVQEYKGPILFSWAKKEQLESLIQINSPNEIEYIDDINSNYPSFFKILLTNFPTQPLEKVKNISFEENCLFNESEFLEFIKYLNLSSLNFDFDKLSQGSLFFLKLGKGKSELLNENLFHLNNGISNSLNFLNKLNKVELGVKNVIEKLPIKLLSFDINPEEIKNPEDEYCHAKIIFGYFTDYKEGIINFKGCPNFYKYFPLSKESHGLNFIVHSTAFRIKTDRTQFEEDTNSTNTSLFNVFWVKFKVELENIKANNFQDFKDIYSNLLISKPLVDENGSEKWFYKSFYEPLIDFLRYNIPTKDGFSKNPENVKIKKIKLQFNVSDFGLDHIEWFEWGDEVDKLLIDEARKPEKLGIEEWSIRDIIKNAENEKINNWIKGLDDENYLKFLKELKEVGLSKETRIKLINIKLFKFSDNNFYSLKEITGYDIKRFDGQTGNFKFQKTDLPLSSFLFHSRKTENIDCELQKLGFHTCNMKYSKFIIDFFKDGWNVYYFENVLDDLNIYLRIAEKCKTNALTSEGKRKLFLNFINESTKFDKVGEETLKKLELFCDNQGKIKSLYQLISGSLSTPYWLNPYKVKTNENFVQLNSYLVQEQDLFDKIILPNIETIRDELTESKEINELVTFFKKQPRPFFNEYIIQKQTSGYKIIYKSAKFQIIPPKDERTTFIDFIETYLSEELIVLPYDFLDFNEEDGILKGEKLLSLILDLVDIDEHKKNLVEIIQYNNPIRMFLNEISEVRFNSEVSYSKEDFEFKILNLACEKLKESDFSMFRDKIVIEKAGQSFYYSNIPKNTDSLKFESKEFSLSKLFPSTHENCNLLSDLVIQFSQLGISNEKLITLLGINEKYNETAIFKKLVSKNRENRKNKENNKFENTEQFLFFIYFLKFHRNFGLDPFNHLVYPSDFALKKEALPHYVTEWLNQNKLNILDLEKVGLHTETSTLVALRRFFISKTDFNLNKIAEKLSSNETLLLNTLELLKEKNIELKNDNEFSVVKEIIRVINSRREKEQELKLQVEYNLESLEGKSSEWKSIGEFSIFQFNGPLPKVVRLNEFGDYIFYRFTEGDYAVDGTNIYINEKSDHKKALEKVVSDENNNFKFEDLWKLFNSEEPSGKGPETIKDILPNVSDEEIAYISEIINISRDEDGQIDANTTAKIKTLMYLKANKDVSNVTDKGRHLQVDSDKIIVRSAQKGLLYLDLYDWGELSVLNKKIAVYTNNEIMIFDSQKDLFKFCKPQNTFGVLRMPNDYTLNDFNNLDAIKEKSKWHFVFIVNKDAKAAKSYKELLNLDDYNNYG